VALNSCKSLNVITAGGGFGPSYLNLSWRELTIVAGSYLFAGVSVVRVLNLVCCSVVGIVWLRLIQILI
jgi:hypothetical protein